MNIANSTILITGSNRGIGKTIVEAVLAAGAKKVYATARNIASVQPLADQYGDKIVPLALDVSKSDSVQIAADAAGDVDIVINNAGILRLASPLDPHAIDTFKEELETNVYGLLRIAQAFAPILKANGGGVLAQLNSVASLKNFSDFATYSASKAASYSLTQGLREKLAEQNTQVVSVHPGPIKTDMADEAGFGDVGDPPSVVANEIVRAIEAGDFHAFPDTIAQQFWTGYQPFAENFIEPTMAEA